MKPVLCYVTDRRAAGVDHSPARLLAIVRQAVTAGVDWIQVREKDLPGGALSQLVRDCLAAAEGTSTRILVNDRLDVAVATGAAGVHLGTESLPVREVVEWCRERMGSKAGQGGSQTGAFLVGRSCHSLQEARAAESDGASYIIFGPVFATPSKAQYGAPLGLERLAEVCAAVRTPVLAIGGITAGNAGECRRAGAAGIAAVRLFQDAADIGAAVRELRMLRP